MNRTHAVLSSLLFIVACSRGGAGNKGLNQPSNAIEQRLTPRGFPILPEVVDNPLTEAGIALGRRLFHEPLLSANGQQSCASCHLQRNSFSDPERTSLGITGKRGSRQAMALVNLAWAPSFFWDGRSISLEAQALEPVINPIEMAEQWDNVVLKVSTQTDFAPAFAQAFGDEEITSGRVAKAIAQFERTLIAGNSRYDQSLRGATELTREEEAGRILFFSEQAECFHCHASALLTDQRFHNNGLDSVPVDLGLGARTGKPEDSGLFKTPTLRNIALTAPYMHDGRFATLAQVVDHYDNGVQPSGTLDPLLQNGRKLAFTSPQKLALIAFLQTLTDTDLATRTDLGKP